MHQKINDKLISIPPYLSAAWKDVRALFLNGEDLHVALVDGTLCVIPRPEKDLVDEIFDFHSRWLEKTELEKMAGAKNAKIEERAHEMAKELPLFSFGGSKEGMMASPAMQHNPELANAPDIPKETLRKIAGIARVLVPNELHMIPPAEPHCNCPHCQISRAVQASVDAEQAIAPAIESEEIVTPQDLKFRTWDIEELSENLFLVKNPLDAMEEYRVFLGDTIGCTCGHSKCEHIGAVLNT